MRATSWGFESPSAHHLFSFDWLNMNDPSKPSVLRWITVGVACYSGWLLANLLLALIFPLLILIELLGGRPGRRFLRGLSVGFLRVFFLGYLPLTRIYHVERVPSMDEMKSTGPCLLVANHRSWLDALILIAVVPGVRVLVNTGYSKVPLVGRGMRWVSSALRMASKNELIPWRMRSER